MTSTIKLDRRGEYGYDAPHYMVLFGVAAVALLGGGAWLTPSGGWAGPVLILLGVLAAVITASFLYATRRGKFVVWQHIIDGLGPKPFS